MTGWEQFTEGLARHLAELPSGAVVKIIESDESADVARYAQFLQTDSKLIAEVVGDGWLAPELGAGTAGSRLLADAGWHQPDEDHSGNWWLDSTWPIDSASYRRIASMVVTGLRDAFRISDLSTLYYEAWNGNAGNRKLDLPLLGLPSPG
ncbi:TY-Chap domain-containing protein [Nocardia sp. NPDC051321]|uniref:TY-Chap domain-containing protein n=1 Tax=Nocardia sp. NPDC051321 TaxID=3364323 RepID=UPI0037B72355